MSTWQWWAQGSLATATQLIALRLADRLGSRVVLESPVRGSLGWIAAYGSTPTDWWSGTAGDRVRSLQR